MIAIKIVMQNDGDNEATTSWTQAFAAREEAKLRAHQIIDLEMRALARKLAEAGIEPDVIKMAMVTSATWAASLAIVGSTPAVIAKGLASTGKRNGDPRIIDENYDPGVPGRACTSCNMAWPADEDDDAHWHHRAGCEVAS